MPSPRLQKWLVFSAVSAAFFFLNLATFTSLGVVLYGMVAELHWSMTAAGFSFSLLGIACGLSSPLPALTMRWFGGRATISLGAGLLFAGFVLASLSHSLPVFYLAMILLGVGFSLAGNVPGVALIAGWFSGSSSRIIGLYLMLGAVGAAFGPPIVVAIVNAGGWRSHWVAMAAASGVVGALCLAWVRDVGPLAAEADSEASFGEWTPRAAILTPQFLLVAAAMTMTMACVTTNSSVAVSHLAKLGATPAAAAYVLSIIAISATLVKGAAGRLCEKLASPTVLAIGLVFEAIGCVLLAFADTTELQYAAALAFGSGWGMAYVAGTVVLIDYFGPVIGARILSVVWLITTLAAVGPVAAGMIADHTGSFAPIFQIYAGMLMILVLPVFFMRAPIPRPGLSPA